MKKFYAYWIPKHKGLYKPDHIPAGCQYYCKTTRRWLKEKAMPWWWTHIVRRWPVKQGQAIRSQKAYEAYKEGKKV